MNQFKNLILSTVLAGTFSLSLQAENWGHWRGPAYDGSTPEKNLPVEWSKTDAAWVTPLPGFSGATPAVWGDYVFVSSPDAQKNLTLLCLDARDGKVRWQQTVAV